MGAETRKENVTPSGTPEVTKPMKRGTAEQEQNGVTTPSNAANMFPADSRFLARIRRALSGVKKDRTTPTAKTTRVRSIRIFGASNTKNCTADVRCDPGVRVSREKVNHFAKGKRPWYTSHQTPRARTPLPKYFAVVRGSTPPVVTDTSPGPPPSPQLAPPPPPPPRALPTLPRVPLLRSSSPPARILRRDFFHSPRSCFSIVRQERFDLVHRRNLAGNPHLAVEGDGRSRHHFELHDFLYFFDFFDRGPAARLFDGLADHLCRLFALRATGAEDGDLHGFLRVISIRPRLCAVPDGTPRSAVPGSSSPARKSRRARFPGPAPPVFGPARPPDRR